MPPFGSSSAPDSSNGSDSPNGSGSSSGRFPIESPLRPMLARVGKEIPDAADMLFEPKWDGFRCVVFRDGEELILQARSGKSLNRYFPEVVARLKKALPERVVLDGELVIALHGRLDFDALTERIHPAQSRIELLSQQTPASYVAFDLLALGDESFMDKPTKQRRQELSNLPLIGGHPGGDSPLETVHITPATTESETARQWFTLFEGAGLDGVIGKPLNAGYAPGKRVMTKYKHVRSADCVLAGLRWHVDGKPGELLGSLLLGLHDENGVLHHVGVVGSFPRARREELAKELAPLITDGEHPWVGDAAVEGQRLPGGITRWKATESAWVPLRPERVVEVSYEHTEGGKPARFRHTAQFLRWRPDREPNSCDYAQLDEPANYDLDAVLQGEVRSRK